MYDPFYEAAVDLRLPLSFHILTSTQDQARTRGPKLNAFMAIIRGCQDIIGTFIFGGVFERHPRLRVVCVEADAGWVPHFMYRMDHAYDAPPLLAAPPARSRRMPSEYFREHVYTTFQDDWIGLPGEGPLQHPPPDVGQRLPAQRFHVAGLAGACWRSTPRT